MPALSIRYIYSYENERISWYNTHVKINTSHGTIPTIPWCRPRFVPWEEKVPVRKLNFEASMGLEEFIFTPFFFSRTTLSNEPTSETLGQLVSFLLKKIKKPSHGTPLSSLPYLFFRLLRTLVFCLVCLEPIGEPKIEVLHCQQRFYWL